MQLEVYHSQEFRPDTLKFPILAEGIEMWLGDGYYFWQDYQFATWWGESHKKNRYKTYSIFKTTLTFEDENFIDTVFKEDDYYYFIEKVEDFARKYQKKFHKRPTLEEFNDFIDDFNLWAEIDVIRFQDVPENNYFVEVDGYYYKKRIQIRVKNPKIVTNFVHYKDLLCLQQ